MKIDPIGNALLIIFGAGIAVGAAWYMDHLGAVALAGLILVYVGSLRFK